MTKRATLATASPARLDPLDGANGSMALLCSLERSANNLSSLHELLKDAGHGALSRLAWTAREEILQNAEGVGEVLGLEVNLA